MAEKKRSCGCGCLPQKKNEIKSVIPTKNEKKVKRSSKKSR